MTTKNFSAVLLSAAFALALFSCNGGDSKKDETVKVIDSSAVTTTTTATAPAAAPMLTAPFDILEVTFGVKNYATWRAGFDNDSAARKSAGLEDLAACQNADDSNKVIVVAKVDDMQKAKDFMADPRLKALMDKGGVNTKPDIGFFHVIRFNASSHEKQWVMVTHRVKDFNAFLKVYDGEGPATRASQGMTDVAFCRAVDDSNNVQVVFDITDMAKAKPAMLSDDKRKLMMSAGVIGAPKITFYKEQ